MAQIHSTAVVDSNAKIAETAVIGPYCVVGGDVEVGDGVELVSHVSLTGRTSVGDGTKIYPFASIGSPPQDLKYRGEPSRLIIGKNNQIRESVTMNPGTEGGGMVTRIGDNCLFMVGAHVAHDCILGNNVILANNATLAGHVIVGDHVVLGGLSAVHQFVRIGKHAMMGGMSGSAADVIPFGMVIGARNGGLGGLNLVGMKRCGFSRTEIHAMRAAYKMLFAPEGTLQERLDQVETEFPDSAAVKEVTDFMREDTSRSYLMPITNLADDD